MLLIDSLAFPQIPCPEVQPFPIEEPKPTSNPPSNALAACKQCITIPHMFAESAWRTSVNGLLREGSGFNQQPKLHMSG